MQRALSLESALPLLRPAQMAVPGYRIWAARRLPVDHQGGASSAISLSETFSPKVLAFAASLRPDNNATTWKISSPTATVFHRANRCHHLS